MEGANIKACFQIYDDNYFLSLNKYSKFMLNKEFYKNFIEYDYMLIYQLDAWVFEDQLEYWCNQNYDYIGAPWFEGFHKADESSKMLDFAGNGGFSLRKIDAILKVLNKKYRKSLKQSLFGNKKQKLVAKIINLPVNFIKYCLQFTKNYWQDTKLYEDYAFVTIGPLCCQGFKVAPSKVAMKFSFEVQPKRLYQMNDYKLPFGCHAFEKYDYDFWKQFILF